MIPETPRVSILIPLYNEAAIFPQVLTRLFEVADTWEWTYEIIVVDDGSNDGGVYSSERPNFKCIRHPINLGNGASIKTGIRHARGEWCVILDADGQHDPHEARELLQDLEHYSLSVGARNFSNSGTVHRNFANQIYASLASYMTSTKIPDLTSGFRAFRRKDVMEIVHLFPNRFSCPTTMTMGMLKMGHAVHFRSISVAPRVGESKIHLLRDGSRFFLIIIKIATLFSPLKIFLPLALGLFLVGLGVYVIQYKHMPSLAALMILIVNPTIIFLLGLIAEQISALNLKKNYLVEYPKEESS